MFVAPAKVNRSGEIRDPRRALAVRGMWAVANTGNVHFRTDRVEFMRRRVTGRGSSHRVSRALLSAWRGQKLRFDIPRDACARLAVLEASVVFDNLT